MSDARKDLDLELWKTWKRTRSKPDLDKLLKQMTPIIQKETNRWSGGLARSVIEVEAYRLSVQAFENYNENMGAALATHLTNYLQKLSRLIYTQQNVARIPEYQVLQVNAVNRAKNDLADRYGRDATIAELAEHMSWSQAAVSKMLKAQKTEHLEFHDKVPSTGLPSEDGMIDLVYHDLNPQQKLLFEYTTGYGGKEALDNKSIMEKLNMSQGQLSYEKRRLVNQINTLRGNK